MEGLGFIVGNAAFPMKQYKEEEKNKILSEVRKAGLEL